MAHHAARSTLPAAIFLAMVSVGCGDDASTLTQPPDQTVADIGGYLTSLPSWEDFAQPMPDDEVVGEELGVFQQQGNLLCTERKANLTRNPEEIVMFSPDAEVMWLGSLIQGRGHLNGLGSLMELPIRQRAPVTVSIDLLYSDNNRVVGRPDVASVGQAIGELIDRAEAAGHRAGSSIFFKQVESHSFDQAAASLGLSTRYLGPTVRLSVQTERTDSSSSVLATFTQKMFTTSVVLPQSPETVFGSDLTPGLLQEQIDAGSVGPDNLPVYVSSITWGRMLVAEITGHHRADSLKAALSVSAGSDSAGIAGRHKEILDESEIKVSSIGGHAQATIDLIRTGRLSEYFREDAPLTSARPISYVLRNLGDNSVAKVSETTEYTFRECQERPRRYASISDWIRAVDDIGLTHHVLETSATNLALAEEIATPPGEDQGLGVRLTFLGASTDFPLDFYLENRSALNIPDLSYHSDGLVWRDTELNGHHDAADRWISVGETDGSGGAYKFQFENDDFDLVVERVDDAHDVYAIGIWVGDNDDRIGESVTIKGVDPTGQADFTFVFDDIGDVGEDGFFGFVSPIPIRQLLFNEDAGGGGDDIAVRDFHFGVR